MSSWRERYCCERRIHGTLTALSYKQILQRRHMRFVIIFTVLAVFGSTGFCDEPQDHGIRRPQPKEEGIRRRAAPKSEDVGMSGQLMWVNERLALQTPSGKKYVLTSSGKEMDEKLLEVSEKKKTSVDLDGTLSEGKFKVKSIESTFSNEEIEEGSFTIGYSENLSQDDKEEIISKLNNLSGVKIEDESVELPFLMITTDSSMAYLKSKINKDPFLKNHITVSRTTVRRTTVSGVGLNR